MVLKKDKFLNPSKPVPPAVAAKPEFGGKPAAMKPVGRPPKPETASLFGEKLIGALSGEDRDA